MKWPNMADLGFENISYLKGPKNININMHTLCKWEITFEIIQWSAVNCSYLTWRDINSAI